MMPTTRNVSLAETADGTSVAEICAYGDQNIPYVFASSDAMFAMTYAVPRGVRLGNYRGCNRTQIVLVDKESLIGAPAFDGGMFSFQTTGFIQVHEDGRPLEQWVSDKPVDLTTAAFTPVGTFEDLMHAGVQVFQIAERESIGAERLFNDWTRISKSVPDESAWLHHVAELLSAGHLRWLNQEGQISEQPCLPHQSDCKDAASRLSVTPPPKGFSL